MANSQITDTAVNSIAECLKNVDAVLPANPSHGALNFDAIKPEIESLGAILASLYKSRIEGMSEPLVLSLIQSLDAVNQSLSKIRNFRVNTDNPTGVHADIVSGWASNYGAFTKNAAYLVFPVLLKQQDLSTFQSELREIHNHAQEQASLSDQHLKDIEAKLKAIIQLEETAKTTAATIGASSFVNEFGTLADRQSRWSKVWLTVTAVLAALTIGLAVIAPFKMQMFQGFLSDDPNTPGVDPVSSWLLAQIVTSKIILFGVLIGATIWCGRLYKALKHQQAINEHRSRALETFKSFVTKANDDQTKDAVLLETTRSIFAITSPGYFAPDDGSSDGSTKIVEIVKSIAQSGTPKA